jgi:hypothetical protein
MKKEERRVRCRHLELHLRLFVFLVALAVLVLLRPLPALAQQAIAADSFVDAVGVNIHLHYDGTPYRTQFPLIKERLRELAVRHIRDGLIDTTWQGYYDRLNELGDMGIKSTLIVTPEQSTDVWIQYPRRVSRTFAAYEGPNEYDRSGKSNWAQIVRATMTRLGGLRGVAGLENYPIYGPSLTSAAAFTALGDISATFDYVTMHNYFAGRHPSTGGWGANGYGSIRWNLELAGRYGGGKPAVTTETGYQDVSTAVDFVPREVAGNYLPKLLLEQYRAGVTRTFLYELCDFPGSGGYGLLDDRAMPKPGFHAVKGLLTLLADPGPAFTPAGLSYSVIGDTGGIRHMLFQKRDGTYYLALWQSGEVWDPITRTLVTAPRAEIAVTLSFPGPMRIIRRHQWQPDGMVVAENLQTTNSTLRVTVPDRLVIVEAARVPGSAPFRHGR